MGQAMSIGLTQNDVEELIEHSGGILRQSEIEGLYKRFRTLDKGYKGYISTEEFMSIPELSINPLQKRMEHMFENVNFKEFVRILAPFSSRASREDRIGLVFRLYDIDNDGIVTAADLELMVRWLGGTTMKEDVIKEVVKRALSEAETPHVGLTMDDFRKGLAGNNLDVSVEFPCDC